MSVKAVGAYIDKLIARHDLKVQEVTDQAGVSANYVWRLRTGAIKEPAAHIIASLTKAVQGSMEDITQLLLDDNATVDDGERAAMAWFAKVPKPPPITLSERQIKVLSSLSPDDLDYVLDLAERLKRTRSEHQ